MTNYFLDLYTDLILIEKRFYMNTKNRLLKIADMVNQFGVSRSTIWRWRKAKIIPEPMLIGARLVAWRSIDIEQWLEKIKKDGEV